MEAGTKYCEITGTIEKGDADASFKRLDALVCKHCARPPHLAFFSNLLGLAIEGLAIS